MFFRSLAILSAVVAITNAQLIGITEGPIFSVQSTVDGDGVLLNVMGVSVTLPQSSFDNQGITSGSGKVLTLGDVLGGSLPGRSASGFLGATCKCEEATINPDGSLVGIVCVLEAAENIMLSLVTGKGAELDDPVNPDGCFLLIGDGQLKVLRNTDERYKFNGAIDGEGFELDFCSIPAGATALAAGYLGDDNVFYAFEIEASAGTRIGEPAFLTTIARVRCTVDKIEVRGSITNPAGTDVEIIAFDSNGVVTQTWTEPVGVFDPVLLAAEFRLRDDVDGCPASVQAISVADESSATFTL